MCINNIDLSTLCPHGKAKMELTDGVARIWTTRSVTSYNLNIHEDILRSCLTSLRPLKFKRRIDKNGSKITYVASDFGVSYAMHIYCAQLSHNFGWYIITNGKKRPVARTAYIYQCINLHS